MLKPAVSLFLFKSHVISKSPTTVKQERASAHTHSQKHTHTLTRQLSASTHSSFTSLTVSSNPTITSSFEKNAELFFFWTSFLTSLPRWNSLPCSVSEEEVEETCYNGKDLDIFLLVNKRKKNRGAWRGKKNSDPSSNWQASGYLL